MKKITDYRKLLDVNKALAAGTSENCLPKLDETLVKLDTQDSIERQTGRRRKKRSHY